MSDYGSPDGVKALTRHIKYGTANNPTGDELNVWLVQRSAILNGWIAAAGLVVPVTLVTAKAALDTYANYGAAADAESALAHGGYSDEDEDRREVWFERRFREAKAWIESGALQALGVPIAPVSQPGITPSQGSRIGLIQAGSDYRPR